MGTTVGYARCSTASQDLTAQREQLAALGVPSDRVYLDKGLTGTSRARPGLDQALAAVRDGDTLTVTKLDRRGALGAASRPAGLRTPGTDRHAWLARSIPGLRWRQRLQQTAGQRIEQKMASAEIGRGEPDAPCGDELNGGGR
jgi:Resolvase, N terminal domain